MALDKVLFVLYFFGVVVVVVDGFCCLQVCFTIVFLVRVVFYL